MADQLIIRAYDVELGDCIHVCIPKAKKTDNGNEDFNILIDCGTLGPVALVEAAIKHLETVLPDSDQAGKKLLDLIVVSHEHKDHIQGFDPNHFEKIVIGDIWMSAAMDPAHDQALETNNLHALADRTMKSLAEEGLSLHPDLEGLMAMYSLLNVDAMKALRTTLPADNGFQPQYVHAGMTGEDLGLDLDDTVIKILGPENDIDHYYFGKEMSDTLNGFQTIGGEFACPDDYEGAKPKNISQGDFHRLRSRMLSNALAFAKLSSEMKNNTGAILLIEWKGKRLLFVGDLEWEDEYREGRQNFGWNVAWHARKPELDKPLDFLKIGHHGSINATPWNDMEDGTETEPGAILDAILPEVDDPKAKVVVSTMRKKYPMIPSAPLLLEIAKRVTDTKNYKDALIAAEVDLEGLKNYEEYEKEWLESPQPLRTDFEELIEAKGYVEVVIEAD